MFGCSVFVVVPVALGVVLSFGPPVPAFAAACSASQNYTVPLLSAPVVAFPAF